VPPAQIRQLREDTRLRADLTKRAPGTTSGWSRLLEDALIKVSSVASKLDGLSVRDMLEALIAGERDPEVLAGLARGKLKARHGALAEALAGRFDDHHAELAACWWTRSTPWAARSPRSPPASNSCWRRSPPGRGRRRRHHWPGCWQRPGRGGAARRRPAG
jgi:hypothetical protein